MSKEENNIIPRHIKSSRGILISIDLESSTEIKKKYLNNPEKKIFNTQIIYQQQLKVYYNFLNEFCITNLKFLDQVYFIKSLGDEFWFLIQISELPSEELLKSLYRAMKSVPNFESPFKLENSEELIKFKFRIFAEFYEEIHSSTSVFLDANSDFIRSLFFEKNLSSEELSNIIYKYSNTLTNITAVQINKNESNAFYRFDPFGTEIDLFFRMAGRAKKMGNLVTGKNLKGLFENKLNLQFHCKKKIKPKGFEGKSYFIYGYLEK